MATNNPPKKQRTERAARNDFVRVCSYIALVVSALLLFINKLLPLCGITMDLGTVGRVLDFICYLALLIGIVFGQKNLNIENERLIYTVKEVATLLHSSPNYIYQLIEKGFLPALKLGSVKILKSSLQKFLIDNEGFDLSDINNVKKLSIQNL